jgi:hypothetical protein
VLLAMAPAKLLAFYEDSTGIECAIVHSVDWSTGKECELGNTRLVTNYIREFTSSGWPAIRKIGVENIQHALYAIERKKGSTDPLPPRCFTRSKQQEYIVLVTTPQTTWATIFYHWAKSEVSPWSDELEISSDMLESAIEESDLDDSNESDQDDAVSGLI